MGDSCLTCARLGQENAKLRQIVREQRAKLKAIGDFTNDIVNKADEALSQHEPGDTWSRWRGRRETANKVYRLLRACN
jgi:hypothetical protein